MKQKRVVKEEVVVMPKEEHQPHTERVIEPFEETGLLSSSNAA